MRKIIKHITKSVSPPLLVLLIILANHVVGQGAVPLNPKFANIAKPGSTTGWIDFREGTAVNPQTIFVDLKDAFELSNDDQMKIKKIENDELGFTHYRYQQYYKNLKVLYGEFLVHQQPDGFVKSANGCLITGLHLGNTPSISEKQALETSLSFMNAKKYLWQNEEMEGNLKREKNDPAATYFPKGELIFVPTADDELYQAQSYRLAWQFNVYTEDPGVSAKSVCVDALTNTVIYHTDISMNCSTGSGNSAFNGSVSVYTQLNGASYRSQNDCQTANIYVYNCGGGGATNTFYTDADNVWTNASAVQAQYGAAQTYSYYIGEHSRSSWDNANGALIAYNNANAGQNNACWGCNGNNAIFYAGNTSSATDDWNTDDIMGHEFTHGVTQASAGLAYQKESGGLNESFSDIFGEMVESWTEGNCDYLVGADRGAIRSFINPKAYNQPDTYLGTNWYNLSGCSPTSSNDNCGVHTNSGVQNRFFYLLSEGGSGTNDNGSSYSVTGITRFKARQIEYRALTVYLNSSSQYIDARKASLEAAWDLYGQCSAEIVAVGDAWHAVGVEAQSPQYAKNFCGTYPAGGTFLQSISYSSGANGCAMEITPNGATTYLTARDQVILFPGFHADNGSNFVAYLEPCSSTMWRTSGSEIMSDAEKGIINTESLQNGSLVSASDVSIAPNPFNSNFEISINLKTDDKAKLIIYNPLGMKVKELMERNLSKGLNKTTFDGSDLASGVYMIEITLGDSKIVKRIVKN